MTSTDDKSRASPIISDRLLTADEAKALMPWRDVETGKMFFEHVDGSRVFIPRELLIHIFQRYSEVIAGLAAKR
jgi:hypothetical protein